MCRMMAAPLGIPGRFVSDAFLRMARGENALNERNTALGLVQHGDGWGAVLEAGGRTIRVRSPRPCWDDPAFAQVRSTSVRLLHARLASSGGRDEVHAHPFSIEIGGETWTFCHNGTIRDLPDDGSGATDSERFFRRLAPMLASGDPVTAFEVAAAPLRDVTSLNSLLLGPAGLWAFCVWTDPTYRAYYTLAWAETTEGVVVASEPLVDLDARWISMENGSVLWIPAPGSRAAPEMHPLRFHDGKWPTTAGE